MRYILCPSAAMLIAFLLLYRATIVYSYPPYNHRCQNQKQQQLGDFMDPCRNSHDCKSIFHCSSLIRQCICLSYKYRGQQQLYYDRRRGECLGKVGQFCTVNGIQRLEEVTCVENATCKLPKIPELKSRRIERPIGKCRCENDFMETNEGLCISKNGHPIDEEDTGFHSESSGHDNTTLLVTAINRISTSTIPSPLISSYINPKLFLAPVQQNHFSEITSVPSAKTDTSQYIDNEATLNSPVTSEGRQHFSMNEYEDVEDATSAATTAVFHVIYNITQTDAERKNLKSCYSTSFPNAWVIILALIILVYFK